MEPEVSSRDIIDITMLRNMNWTDDDVFKVFAHELCQPAPADVVDR